MTVFSSSFGRAESSYKADYIGILKERIEALEKQRDAAKREGA